MLSDIVESIVGALFVSEGYSVQVVEVLFESLFKPFYDKHISLHSLTPHPNTTLFELLQAEGCHQHRLVKYAEGSEIRYEGMHAYNCNMSDN